jgi:peptidoglycan/LPS O-acetylase OafA/YrhL
LLLEFQYLLPICLLYPEVSDRKVFKRQHMSVQSNYSPHLDGWRGLAIGIVLFAHFAAKAQFWWAGLFGVQLFFVLSGLLMCNILFFRNAPLPGFFIKRLIRVVPTFFLFVLALTICTQTLQPVTYSPSSFELASVLVFLRSYFPSHLNISNDSWAIAHLWSLNVEEHAYIFLAGLAYFTRRLNRAAITAALLLAATVCILAISQSYFLHSPTGATLGNMRSEAASLGIVATVTLAFLKRHWLERYTDYVPQWLPVACIVVAFLCFSTYRWRGVHFTVAPLCLAFAINYLHRLPSALTAVLALAPLRWLGRVSFSLYLWQQPYHFAVCNYGLNGVLGFMLAVITGLVSFYAFEHPVRIWLTRLWEERSQPTSAGMAVN